MDAQRDAYTYDDELRIGVAFATDISTIGPTLQSGHIGTTGYLVTGHDLSSLNLASIADSRVDAAHVEEVLELMDSFAVPYGLSAPSDIAPDVVALITARGLKAGESSPVLLLDDAERLAAYTAAPNIQFDLVSEDNYDDFVAAMVAVFDFPTQILELGWADKYPVRCGHMDTRLAFVDGEIAGVSQMRLADRAIGVFNVGVVERFRGRGLGRALTHASISDGLARGGTFAFLGATEMGYRLYKSMGFRDAGNRIGFAPVDETADSTD